MKLAKLPIKSGIFFPHQSTIAEIDDYVESTITSFQ